MKKTHKVISIALTALLTIAIFPFSALAADEANQSSYEFDTAISGPLFGRPLSEYQTKAKFDFKWITSDNPRLFNKDLASASSLLATDIYSMAYVKGPSGKGIIGNAKTADDYTYLLKDFGFDDVKFVDLATQKWEQDQNDVAGLVLAHRAIKVNNKNYDAFACVVRGTQGEGEWSSDLDVGAQTDAYANFTGDHPEWLNKSNHKGFDVCANRIATLVDSYISDKSSSDSQKTMLITGHSRGAAEANILGAMYEKDENIRSYTYTFSCPLTTLVNPGEATSYKSVFNYCEKNDLVGMVPANKWGFTRYGNDIIGDSFADSKYKSLIEEMMGATFVNSDKKTVIDSLSGIAETPADLYADRKDKTKISPDEAKASIDYLDISDCYWIGDEANSDGNYDRIYSPYFFLKASSKTLEDLSKLTRTSGSYDLADKITSIARSTDATQMTMLFTAQDETQLEQALSEPAMVDLTDAAKENFNAVQKDSEDQITEAKSLTAAYSLDFLKDILAIKQLIPNTTVEGPFNTFNDADKVSMLMPHLTATTKALAEISNSPTSAAATSFGLGEIIFLAIFVGLAIAAIAFFVIFTRKKNSKRR
ncbi:MAG: hypothetical protein MJ189_02570 [Coriobacteriales bacterium]|nr:hypothetical protein [Coriobacteriales bacterium]